MENSRKILLSDGAGLGMRAAGVLALMFVGALRRLQDECFLERGDISACVEGVCSEIALHGVIVESGVQRFETFFDAFMEDFDSDGASHLEQALADIIIAINELLDMSNGQASLDFISECFDDWVFWWIEGDLDQREEVLDVEGDARLVWYRSKVSRVVEGFCSAVIGEADVSQYIKEARDVGREISFWVVD
ncbi:hypothetical protein [Nocardiopsis sp. CNT312]|uniref:hypothetical protein n=1 Tax=Nocardiopsis sp. CNT312 TaxID=1137268 RepID=UPI0012DF360F|nr:hypothetical protein [Nocardiopsis sp. CNT312]